ncbi:MAG: hypothetical protein MHPSP_000340, partial [Paramarteilia canceri]
VGKSCILLQFTDKKFNPTHDLTIGVEFGVRTINLDEETVKIQIWDTAGQEAFRAITNSYMNDRAAALVVYDITEKSSFENVKYWIDTVRSKASEEITIMLIGNKSDLGSEKREVTETEAQQYAFDNNLCFAEISAKSSTDCQKVELYLIYS